MIHFEHRQVQLREHDLHVVRSGDPKAPPYLFLHGWPLSWSSWHDVMIAAADEAHCVAIDLPGIGGSRGAVAGGHKLALATVLHELIAALDLRGVTIVGHDVGGMIAYAYLREYADVVDSGVARVAIINTVIPGVAPWDEVMANPAIWHFAFHAIPELPEILVHGHELAYFGYFFDAMSGSPDKPTLDRRALYASAYSDRDSLRAGFELYRAMQQDAEDNRLAADGPACITPLEYIRGDRDPRPIASYENGFRDAGVRDLITKVIRGAGHFVGDEAPRQLWDVIHADRRTRRAA
ncbi:MAG: alpha/beta fold hydrolase [Kofleriaceae bacterium]